MTNPINSKRTPPPPRQGTFNRPLIPAGLLIAVFAASLLLTACPSPGGGTDTNPPGDSGTTTPGGGTTAPTIYTTTVTGTVTASPSGRSYSIDLPGAKISALTTPPNPVNQPAAARPDGSFTLQVKHQGTFRLKVDNTCSEPFTTTDITASADGSHNAGELQLTLKSEPAAADRYSITQKSPGSFKLTVKECVRDIVNNEFSSSGTIITAAADDKGAIASGMITEISLPSTLRSIGESGLGRHTMMSGTLTIPRNVETLANNAFRDMALNSPAPPAVVFETGSRLRSIGDSAFLNSRLKDFTLPENLETI